LRALEQEGRVGVMQGGTVNGRFPQTVVEAKVIRKGLGRLRAERIGVGFEVPVPRRLSERERVFARLRIVHDEARAPEERFVSIDRIDNP